MRFAKLPAAATLFVGGCARQDGGIWVGALGGSSFELRTRPAASVAAGCSDGMSDKRYPFAVTLTVNGEQRRGCAEPAAR